MKLSGTAVRWNSVAMLVKVMTSVTAVTRNVDMISSLDDELCTNGTFAVLIICMISDCDIIPKANHPVWNREALSTELNPNTNQSTAKHSRSSTVEIEPNTNM